ncbi:hypothetical protein LguiB_001251 [Lonicera macranthoides]
MAPSLRPKAPTHQPRIIESILDTRRVPSLESISRKYLKKEKIIVARDLSALQRWGGGDSSLRFFDELRLFDVEKLLGNDVKHNPVMIYVEGVPELPRRGFSILAVVVLNEYKICLGRNTIGDGLRPPTPEGSIPLDPPD